MTPGEQLTEHEVQNPLAFPFPDLDREILAVNRQLGELGANVRISLYWVNKTIDHPNHFFVLDYLGRSSQGEERRERLLIPGAEAFQAGDVVHRKLAPDSTLHRPVEDVLATTRDLVLYMARDLWGEDLPEHPQEG